MSSKKRRIAFVIHDLNGWGGQDRSTLEVARRLSHRYPVSLVCYTWEDPNGAHAWGDLRVYRIKPDPRKPALLRAIWFFFATLPVLFIDPLLKGEPRPLILATGACSLFSDVIQVQWVSRTWQELKKKLPLHVYSPPFATEGGIASWIRSAYHHFLLAFNVLVERWVLRPSKTYIAISHSVAQELEKYFKIKERVHVVYHAVDSTLFCPADDKTMSDRTHLRDKFGINSQDVVGIFVGAYDRKGLAVTLDAMARMNPTLRKNFKLLAIGSGGGDAFIKRAQNLKLGESVIVLGHSREIHRYYRAADFFVLPTLYEPFGLVITEAMASGLAPVVSAISGAAELIENGKSGILLQNPESSDELARVLEKMTHQSDLRKKMGEAALAKTQSMSWDQAAEGYAQVLEPLVRRKA
ncbi:MAG: glycosyltransferase family 4 protein [Bdellovibrionota bacterium]